MARPNQSITILGRRKTETTAASESSSDPDRSMLDGKYRAEWDKIVETVRTDFTDFGDMAEHRNISYALAAIKATSTSFVMSQMKEEQEFLRTFFGKLMT